MALHEAFKGDVIEVFARGTWRPSLPLQRGACRAVDEALGELEQAWATLPISDGAPSLEQVAVAAAEAQEEAAAGLQPPQMGAWPLLSPVASRSLSSPRGTRRRQQRLMASPRGRHGRYYLETTRSWRPDPRQFRWQVLACLLPAVALPTPQPRVSCPSRPLIAACLALAGPLPLPLLSCLRGSMPSISRACTHRRRSSPTTWLQPECATCGEGRARSTRCTRTRTGRPSSRASATSRAYASRVLILAPLFFVTLWRAALAAARFPCAGAALKRRNSSMS